MFDILKRRKAVAQAHAWKDEPVPVVKQSDLEVLVIQSQELAKQQEVIRQKRLEIRKQIDAILKGNK